MLMHMVHTHVHQENSTKIKQTSQNKPSRQEQVRSDPVCFLPVSFRHREEGDVSLQAGNPQQEKLPDKTDTTQA